MAQKPFVLSIKVVVRDPDGRCLLLQRAAASHGNPGKWEFPGGKVTPAENLDQAVQRLVGQETALTIRLQRALGTAQADLPARMVVYLILEAAWEGGQVQLSSEHEAYAWRYPHELLEMDLVRPMLSFAKRYAEGGV